MIFFEKPTPAIVNLDKLACDDNGDTGGHCQDEGQHSVHVEEVSWLTIDVVNVVNVVGVVNMNKKEEECALNKP